MAEQQHPVSTGADRAIERSCRKAGAVIGGTGGAVASGGNPVVVVAGAAAGAALGDKIGKILTGRKSS